MVPYWLSRPLLIRAITDATWNFLKCFLHHVCKIDWHRHSPIVQFSLSTYSVVKESPYFVNKAVGFRTFSRCWHVGRLCLEVWSQSCLLLSFPQPRITPQRQHGNMNSGYCSSPIQVGWLDQVPHGSTMQGFRATISFSKGMFLGLELLLRYSSTLL